MGAYKKSYLDFKHEADESFITLKIFFDQCENDRREVEDDTGSDGYGMNATKMMDDNTETHKFNNSLSQLAAQMTANEEVGKVQ